MMRDRRLGEAFQGHLTCLSSVGVRSVGAGGGSIAYVDSAGLLHVGPQSAGAEAGPATLSAPQSHCRRIPAPAWIGKGERP